MSAPHKSWGRRVAAVAVVAALALVPRPSSAFCRTTTESIPADYNPAVAGCFTKGLPLFWKSPCVSYSLNSQASAQVALVTATRVVDEAFGTWNAVTCGAEPLGIATQNGGTVACAEVRYNKTRPNQNLIVFRDTGWNSADSANTLGLTTVSFDVNTGEIYDADMEINATDKNLTTSVQVPTNGFDLLSIVTHEAGHFLGLAHARDANATMFANYRPGTFALRTLANDDVAGVCEIYPDVTQRRVDPSVSANGTMTADACDFTARHGFSTECEGPAQTSSGNGDGGGSAGAGCLVCTTHRHAGRGAASAGVTSVAFALLVLRRRSRERSGPRRAA